MKAACCACLTELVVNDANGQQTVQNNGIYQLASLLVQPMNRCPRPSQTDLSTTENTDQPDAATVQLQVSYLHCCAAFQIRVFEICTSLFWCFIFAVEKNLLMYFYLYFIITFCASRTRRKMYCGHARLCVCLSVSPRPYAHTTARTRM